MRVGVRRAVAQELRHDVEALRQSRRTSACDSAHWPASQSGSDMPSAACAAFALRPRRGGRTRSCAIAAPGSGLAALVQPEPGDHRGVVGTPDAGHEDRLGTSWSWCRTRCRRRRPCSPRPRRRPRRRRSRRRRHARRSAQPRPACRGRGRASPAAASVRPSAEGRAGRDDLRPMRANPSSAKLAETDLRGRSPASQRRSWAR